MSILLLLLVLSKGGERSKLLTVTNFYTSLPLSLKSRQNCELNPIEMYWGYGKTRYRQVQKSSFEEAKKQVPIALDACPTETLRRFCNRSFRCRDAYRKGLSIKAAAWCVKKQKGHRAISEGVMKEFDAQGGQIKFIPTKL